MRAGSLLVPGLAALWLGVFFPPLHEALLPHAITMTVGGTLVGAAHLANLRLNRAACPPGHAHGVDCHHGLLPRLR